MAKLTRYLQKIFANNSNQVGVFGTGVDKETSKNVETLQSADYEDGWSSAIITNKNYPIWQEMDGVQYGLSYQLKYLFQNGIPEWLSTETYYTNSYCRVGSTIYYSLQDNNTNHNPALDDGYWTPLLTSNRSIGEIVPSTVPLTEAGLHLLDGALISSGMYADFVTYMANLTATAPDCFCTEADWQASVTTYGVCGKFVYDSINNTVRLPKITGFIEGTTDVTALGDLVEAGLPNITGRLACADNFEIGGETGGAFYGLPNTVGSASAQGQGTPQDVGFDASRSNSIYGNSSTVQPQTIKVLYYIVIATSTKTDIQVDIDEIATDLNGKADVDGSNITTNFSTSLVNNMSDTANIYVSRMSMPSSTYDTLTLGASGTTYTAPANGYFVFDKQASDQQFIFIGSSSGVSFTLSASGTQALCATIPVKENDTVTVSYNASGNTNNFKFVYAVGSESEGQ